MKKMFYSTFLAALLALPTMALAIDLTDYVEPDIFWQDSEVELRFESRNGNQDQTSYDGTIGIDYEMEKTTLPVKVEAEAEGLFGFTQGPNDEDDSFEEYEIRGFAEAQKWLKPDEPRKTFLFGRFDVEYIDTEAIEFDDPFTQITAGIGYGRIFNATPLMQAIRIIQDLQKYGVVAANVPDSTYIEVAEIIHQENEYKDRYPLSEYEKYWYEAIEKALRDAGVLTAPNLTAMGVIRVLDILSDETSSLNGRRFSERIIRRRHGWEAQAGIGYVLSDRDGDAGDPVLTVSYEYAKPYGLKWQLVNTASYTSILPDWEFGDTNHEFRNVLEVGYEIDESIDWENRWLFGYTFVNEDDDDNILENELSTTLRYYIYNTLNVEATLRFSHFDQGDNDDDDIVTEFFVALNYNIF